MSSESSADLVCESELTASITFNLWNYKMVQVKWLGPIWSLSLFKQLMTNEYCQSIKYQVLFVYKLGI